MNKKAALFIMMLFIAVVPAHADDQANDENKSFYTGNVYYEKKDYAKALENYRAALDMGLESGNLYYNIGNAYLKTGKPGYAILFYEKARRLIPQDGDLKSNLVYARAMVPAAAGGETSGLNAVAGFLRSPFGDINLNAVAILTLALYLVTVILGIIFMLTPFMVRKLKIIFVILLLALIWSSAAFTMRYYDEEFLKKGITVAKSADAKYEPIESSTTYYKIGEGDEVTILDTREGWRHVRRSDGKSAWVKEDAVGEI
jgi:tetratricopeptide (TPR) repeat protein